MAVVAAAALAALAGDANADWNVRRSSGSTRTQFDQSLFRSVDDPIAAARVLRRLGSRQRLETVHRFEQVVTAEPDDYRNQVALAHALLAAGEGAAAAEHFGAALALRPSALGATWGRARAFVSQGDAARAIMDYRSALQMADERRKAVLAVELVEVAVAAADTEAEIEGRRILVRERPGVHATAALASVLAKGQRFAEAAEVLAAGPQPGGALEGAHRAYDEGRHWAAADELKRAEDALEKALLLAPSKAIELRRGLFTSLIDVNRRRGTLDLLERRLELPRDAVEWEARAALAGENGNARAQWNALNEAVRRRPQDLDLHRRRIEAARRVATVAELTPLLEQLADASLRLGAADTFGEAMDALWRAGGQEIVQRTLDRLLAAPAGHAAAVRVVAELAGRWGDERRAERAWREILRRTPGDEGAIIAMGEARLQRGDRRGALESWRRMLRGSTPRARADAHARLAGTLADHEFPEQSAIEAEKAIALAPRDVRYRRVLAGILERRAGRQAAEDAWRDVLRMAGAPDGAAVRREARTRLVTLWLRGGTAYVATKLGELLQELQVRPADEQVRLCLVELQLRSDRIDDAVATLKPALPERQDVDNESGVVELGFSLVRLLRQKQRTSEATTWLELIATRFPARARAARLQLADMAAAAHQDERAAALASAAREGDGDVPAMSLHAAAVEERAGNLESATSLYRRALDAPGNVVGALELAGVMARTGASVEEQRVLLRRSVLQGTDDEVVNEAGRRAMVVEEALGSLPQLATVLANSSDLRESLPGGEARRRVLALVLTRLVPAVYRSRARTPAAEGELRRLGRIGVRPLLDLAASGDDQAAVAAIEALGMLGRPEVVGELNRLLVADDTTVEMTLTERGMTTPRGISRLRTTNIDVARAIVVALGRLGSESARGALEAVAVSPRPELDLPLLWSLGRVKSRVGAELARRELAHSTSELALVACLTLARVEEGQSVTTLTEIASDAGRPAGLRAAAVLGLALGGRREATALLTKLSGVGAGMVSAAARAALDAAAPDRMSTADLDEATLIPGSSISPTALVRALTETLADRDVPLAP